MRKVFKKTISVLLVAVMVFGAVPLAGFVGLELPEFNGLKKLANSVTEFFDGFTKKAEAATSGNCGDNVTWTFNEVTGTLHISGIGNMNNYAYSTSAPWNSYILNIKEIAIDNGVTNIGNNSFPGCSNVTNIIIPDSVTTIGDYAFTSCKSLINITIPDSVISVGNYAFSTCQGLKSIKLPNGLTCIGNHTFRNCTNIISVIIPDSVTHIGIGAFTNCTSLTDVIIPDSVTKIEKCAFEGCVSLTSVTIPNSVTNVGASSFHNTGIYNDFTNWENDVLYISNHLIKANTSISGRYVIKDCTLTIADEAFYECTHLNKVTIPDGVVSIGNKAFANCTELISIIVPDSVVTIDSHAFISCSKLQKVSLSKNITVIEQSVFSKCLNLEEINFSDGIIEICDNAFDGCSNLKDFVLPESLQKIGNYAFRNCLSISNLQIPCNTCYLGTAAFWGCTGLKELWIPASTNYSSNIYTNIESYSFAYCTNIEKIVLSKGNGVMVDYDSQYTKAPWHISNNLKEVIIEYGITNIGEYAFYNCLNITELTIPDSVTNIEECAFEGCTNLVELSMPASAQIGYNAFKNTEIEKITLTKGTGTMCDYSLSYYEWEKTPWYIGKTPIVELKNEITNIGELAFYRCSELTDIKIPNSVTSIDMSAFEGCVSLTSVTIPNNVTKIEESAFKDCDSLTSITIPNSVTNIGSYTFRNCDSLTSITIPDSVTIIGQYAFENCDSLSNVTISNSITNISNSMFANCNSLTSITIPDSVTIIDRYAFENCDSLSNVTIGNSVTSIKLYAFSHCDSLTSIAIPDSVISIDMCAFENCDNLSSVTIPNSVTSIGSDAFRYCDNLKTIYYGGSREDWKAISGSGQLSESIVVFNCKPNNSDKITISKDFYSCYEGESVFVSGDLYAEDGISNVTLDWRYDDGVEVLSPASIINSDANNASFSVEVKGLSEGMHSVTVYTSSGKSASCTIEVMKTPESELAVIVEPLGGSYYLIDGGLYDQNLNNVSSLQYKVTVRNFYIAPTGTTLDEETKEKLKIENVSAAASLSDYSNLLIDIEALDELRNIGDLEVNESKTVIVNVTPTGTEMPADGVTLDVTATADGKDSVSASTPTEIKDKLYDPQAVVSFNVFNQNIIYKDKKYDSESIEVSVRVTNRIPSSFSGNAAKLKEISDCDITVSEIKISSDDSKLLSDVGIRTEKLNTVLHAGESTVITGTYHINTKHKMDEKVESETVGFSCNVSTSANSPSASKSVTFINENYKNDTSISYEKTSVRNLFEEMRSELQKCDVLNGTEKSLVDYIITSHIMAIDLSDLKNILDATEKVYELSSYISNLDKSYYEIAGEYVLDAILEEADKTEDGIKAIIEECMEALRDSEEFNTFIKWYYDQQNTKNNSNKRVDVRCPVDVYAYDESGKEVLSIIGNVIVKAEDDIHAFVCEDDKIIYLPTDSDYDIKIIATGNGTMDYIVTEYSSESELRKTVYEDIPLVVDEQYTGVVTKSTLPDADTYNLISSDGTEFAYTDVKYVDPDIDVQIEISAPSTTTINYGDKIILHADIEGELPSGYQIKWIASNNNFSMSVSADGKTCTISPESSGDTVFTAVIVDENENTVSSDEQTMTSKAGFFDKIIAFFKKLFGLTQTIPQSKMF